MEKRPDILSDSARQENFYQSSKAWIETLAQHHGLVDKLKVLPNDPTRYPYQRLDVGFIEAQRPSIDESSKEADIQAGILEFIKYGASKVIGEANFEEFVNDIRHQNTTVAGYSKKNMGSILSTPPGGALKALYGRTETPNNHSAIVGYHPNFMALPLYAAALIESINQMVNESKKTFDLFDLTEKMIMPINASLSFAEYDGAPAVETLSLLSNVSLTVPPTASTRLYGIDGETRKIINDRAEVEFNEHIERLSAKNKSAILISDPTGSTAVREFDESGNLAGLRFKRISPRAYKQLERFYFAWPVTMWWNKDAKAAKWYVGRPDPLANVNQASRLVRELALETGRLAGVEVYFGKDQSPLGSLAVAAA